MLLSLVTDRPPSCCLPALLQGSFFIQPVLNFIPFNAKIAFGLKQYLREPIPAAPSMRSFGKALTDANS